MMARMLAKSGVLCDSYLKYLSSDDYEYNSSSFLSEVSSFSQLEAFMMNHVFNSRTIEPNTDIDVLLSNLDDELSKCIENEDYEEAEKIKTYINLLVGRNKDDSPWYNGG